MRELAEGRIGIAFGSGAARGWAHVGVIRALEEAGLAPEIVCGSSSGAVVAAQYAAGRLDAFEAWGLALDRRQVLGYFDFSLRGGLIRARRLVDFLTTELRDRRMDGLGKRLGIVATDLETGQEVWLREGSLYEALLASMALPGLVSPVHHDGRWLVDGGLVNPVPVSLCRAMGAETVIAVDLNTTLLRTRFPARDLDASNPAPPAPSIYDVVTNSVNIMQVRITRSRMAGDPPDLLVTPRLPDFAMLDFHRAEEAIAEGRRAVQRALAGALHGGAALGETS